MEQYASSMSMHSYQIDWACLCLHWKNQEILIQGGHGVIGYKIGGQLVMFDSVDLPSLGSDWFVLLGYERAHGWLSISQLLGLPNLCLNGHLLSTGPLVLKESTCMMRPDCGAVIDLFLTESFAAWGDSGSGHDHGASRRTHRFKGTP